MNRPRLRLIGATLGVAMAAQVALTAAPVAANAPVSAQAALDWNLIAVTTVRGAVPAKFQTEGLIYMSYAQAAVYDAVTKIEGRYVPYHRFHAPRSPRHASAPAAVAAAAYTALAYYFPDQAAGLTTTFDAYVAGLPARGKAAGLAIGRAAAKDIIRLRADDGRDAPTAVYGLGPLAPGSWQVVPPFTSAQTPWVAFMKPFMLRRSSQFRAAPPPDLSSAAWATELNETKDYGAAGSLIRTADQTATAYFWNANVINQYNQAFRDLIVKKGYDLVDAARVLAMGDLVGTDALIACFDTKYHYLFWRPYTAIRNSDIDGNAATTADPTWTPLLATPNHPEYAAAHGCITGAEAEVFAAILHTRRIDVDIPGATLGGSTLTTSRHFARVSDLLTEIVNARVWAGLHYRGSVMAGLRIGRQVTHWTLQRFFAPVKH